MNSTPPLPPSNPYASGTTPIAVGTVPNHLVWAILSTLFCCLPLGITSIVFAAQVNTKLAVGDLAGAQESSDKAKKWALWSVLGWVILVAIYIIFAFVVGGASMLQNAGH